MHSRNCIEYHTLFYDFINTVDTRNVLGLIKKSTTGIKMTCFIFQNYLFTF